MDAFEKKRDIELEEADFNLVLLKIYKLTLQQNPDATEKLNSCLAQMNPYLSKWLKMGTATADELITGLEKAIKLDKYRPKNKSIFLFAIDPDLDYINGEFDTFRLDLSLVEKQGDAAKIRNKFDELTDNRFILTQQFTHDWIRRLKKHPKLVKNAKNASTKTEQFAYFNLFHALAQDFCKEYNLPKDAITVKVVKDWNTSEYRPEKKDVFNTTSAIHAANCSLDLPDILSAQEKRNETKLFNISPLDCTWIKKSSVIVINIQVLKQLFPDDMFYAAISDLAHEMHHALDYLNPRQGALGPQVAKADRQHHVAASNDSNDMQEYLKSATELSSFAVQNALLKHLPKAV